MLVICCNEDEPINIKYHIILLPMVNYLLQDASKSIVNTLLYSVLCIENELLNCFILLPAPNLFSFAVTASLSILLHK